MKARPIQRIIENDEELVLVPLGRQMKYSAKLYAEDYERLLQLGVNGVWNVVNNGDDRLYVTARSKLDGRHVIIARLIANPRPGYSVYYKNGDTLDLRSDNLEIRKNHGIRRDAEHFAITRKMLKAFDCQTPLRGKVASDCQRQQEVRELEQC